MKKILFLCIMGVAGSVQAIDVNQFLEDHTVTIVINSIENNTNRDIQIVGVLKPNISIVIPAGQTVVWNHNVSFFNQPAEGVTTFIGQSDHFKINGWQNIGENVQAVTKFTIEIQVENDELERVDGKLELHIPGDDSVIKHSLILGQFSEYSINIVLEEDFDESALRIVVDFLPQELCR